MRSGSGTLAPHLARWSGTAIRACRCTGLRQEEHPPFPVCQKVGSRPEGRLPNSAPTGRAGVRAMRGPDCLARAAGGADSMRLRSDLCAGTAEEHACSARTPVDPTTRSIRRRSKANNQTPVQGRSEKWGCEVQRCGGEIREVGLRPRSTPSLKRPGRACSSALARPAAHSSTTCARGREPDARASRKWLPCRDITRWRWTGPAPPRARCRARRPPPRAGRRSASPR
jgi:hypothetical protein